MLTRNNISVRTGGDAAFPDIFVKHKVDILIDVAMKNNNSAADVSINNHDERAETVFKFENMLQGTPSPDLEYEPRLDPLAWNKHFQERKSLRFADTATTEETREESSFESLRRSTTVSPKKTLQKIARKYPSVDPIKLLKKYQRNKTTEKPSNNEKQENKYSKYTTASSFRQNKTTTTPIVSPTARASYANKLFDASSLNINPRLAVSKNQEPANINDSGNHESGTSSCAVVFIILFIFLRSQCGPIRKLNCT